MGLFGRCGGVVWKVWWGCLEGVVGLFGRCGGVVWKVWWGCLEGVMGSLKRVWVSVFRAGVGVSVDVWW